jgi:hypothetical protein
MGFPGRWFGDSWSSRVLFLSMSSRLLLACGGEASGNSHSSAATNSGGHSQSSTGGSHDTSGGVSGAALGGASAGTASTVGTASSAGAGSSAGMGSTGGAETIPPGGGATHVTRTCTDPKPREFGGGFVQCQEGSFHRPEATDCQPEMAPPEPRPAVCHPSDECCANADCSAPHSYCSDAHYCTPGCVTDAECPSGSLCLCNALVGLCVPASCRSDAECPASLPCSASESLHGGFACQSPDDECLIDGECEGFAQCIPAGPSGGFHSLSGRSCVTPPK